MTESEEWDHVSDLLHQAYAEESTDTEEQIELYNEMLRETYGNADGSIFICGNEYDVAEAFCLTDPDAYKDGFEQFLHLGTCEVSYLEEEFDRIEAEVFAEREEDEE